MRWTTIVIILVVFVLGYAARGIWPNLIPFKLPGAAA